MNQLQTLEQRKSDLRKKMIELEKKLSPLPDRSGILDEILLSKMHELMVSFEAQRKPDLNLSEIHEIYFFVFEQ